MIAKVSPHHSITMLDVNNRATALVEKALIGGLVKIKSKLLSSTADKASLSFTITLSIPFNFWFFSS
jgi:16S rRNA (guanine1207-N2)-methyltransferase